MKTIDKQVNVEVDSANNRSETAAALGGVAVNIGNPSEIVLATDGARQNSLAKVPNMTELIDTTMERYLTASESEGIRKDLTRADGNIMNTIGMALRGGEMFKPEMAESMAQVRNVTGELSIRVENLTPHELSELHDLIYKPYELESIKARQGALSELVARVRAVGGGAGNNAIGGQRLARIEARINDDRLWTVGEVKMPLDIDGLLGDDSSESFYSDDSHRGVSAHDYQRDQDIYDFLHAKRQEYYNTLHNTASTESSLEHDDWQAELAEGGDYGEDILRAEVGMLKMLAPRVREANEAGSSDDVQDSQEYSEFYSRLNELVADELVDEGEFYVPGTCLSVNDMDYIFQCTSRAKIPLTQHRLGDGQVGVLKDIFGRCRQLIRSDQLSPDTALTTLVVFNYARDKVIPERILKPKNLLLLAASNCGDLRDTVDQLRRDFKHTDNSRVALTRIGEASNRLHDSSRYFIELLGLDKAGVKETFGQNYPSSSAFYDFVLSEIRKKSDTDMAQIAQEHVLALVKLDEHMRKNLGRNMEARYIEARQYRQSDGDRRNLGVSPDSALPAANLADVFDFGDDEDAYEQ